ncbi:hypothetical protein GOV11_02190 [Candidatus Woesearchaeota archaeon]|nr:hypothetical protein [Candidatus Woesearchaeota archaeon]
MAKKKQGGLSSMLSGLTELLFSSVVTKVEGEADVLIHKVETKVDNIIKKIDVRIKQHHQKMMIDLQISALNGVAWLFMLFAIFFYMTEFVGYSRHASFFVLGAILLVFSLYLKYRMLKMRVV